MEAINLIAVTFFYLLNVFLFFLRRNKGDRTRIIFFSLTLIGGFFITYNFYSLVDKTIIISIVSMLMVGIICLICGGISGYFFCLLSKKRESRHEI